MMEIENRNLFIVYKSLNNRIVYNEILDKIVKFLIIDEIGNIIKSHKVENDQLEKTNFGKSKTEKRE